MLACLAGLLLLSACGSSSASEERQRELEDRIRQLEADREEQEPLEKPQENKEKQSEEEDREIEVARERKEYTINSAERRRYLLESGGVAPPGAKVTFDLGPTQGALDQGDRSTSQRWPNGFPAAPGSLNYLDSTFSQREEHRAARWKAAMEEGGVSKYWVAYVPLYPSLSYPDEQDYGPETEGMRLLRSYLNSDEVPPSDVIWSHPRWAICGVGTYANRLQESETGLKSLGCEPTLDWALWAMEQFVDHRNLDQPFAHQLRDVAERKLAQEIRSVIEPPTTASELFAIAIGEPAHLWKPILIAAIWLRSEASASGPDGTAHLEAALSEMSTVIIYFGNEVDAGREPWKSIS